MAAEGDSVSLEVEKFHNYCTRLHSISFRDTEECRKEINALLNDFNSLEFSLEMVNQKASV